MWSALPAQERPARNALTVGVSCVNPMLKPVADAALSSARPAFSFIERSTPKLHQQITGKFGNEKELRERLTKEAFCAPLNISLAPHFHLPLDLSVLPKYDSCRFFGES
jgi:hypothetical protein